ncbi:MAG: phosphoribosylglycinamide formyltransferase [Cytophagaceae bacterium BCCC1]|nr:MAG: phosphoribosylglycinamide formyltransferase [Cytophagaceae bacterium BCCC1]
MIKIAIFASGSGSNAERIVEFFNAKDEIEVSLILTNNPTAGVIERAQRLNIPVVIFNKKVFSKTDKIVEMLQLQSIDWVILAGFLWLVPKNLIKAFENRMINIHPALLPKYGGKGMWGHHVHEAVVANKEVETGITIHYVNENYDEGKIIFQAKCAVTESDSAEEVAKKIHLLEYQYFPEIIHKEILAAKNSVID